MTSKIDTSNSNQFVQHVTTQQTTICVLDLSSQANTKLSDDQLKSIFETELTSVKIREINLGSYPLSDPTLGVLIAKITQTQAVNQLKVDPVKFSDVQKQMLYTLVQDGRKGLKLSDLNGERFGPLFTDYTAYFASKQKVIEAGSMRETTKVALEYYQKEHQGASPKCIVDFGCGSGDDTVPLIKAGCQTIWAIDPDVDGILALRKNLTNLCEIREHPVVNNIVTVIPSEVSTKESAAGQKLKLVHICQSHFINFKGFAPVDFFVSSFTWPYRSPDQFDGMWQKQLEMLAPDAIIVGQFFEKPNAPKAQMTYHTEQEVRQLLAQDFTALFFATQKAEDMQIHGDGSPAEFKSVHHIIAKRKAQTAASK